MYLLTLLLAVTIVLSILQDVKSNPLGLSYKSEGDTSFRDEWLPNRQKELSKVISKRQLDNEQLSLAPENKFGNNPPRGFNSIPGRGFPDRFNNNDIPGQWGGRPNQNRPPFGDRPNQNRPPFGDRPNQNRPPFGDRPNQNRPPFGDRPNQNRPPVGARPNENRPPFVERPQPSRPPFSGGTNGDDPFIWGTFTSNQPSTTDKLSTGRTPMMSAQQQATTTQAGVPLENDCTRQCFRTTSSYNPVCGTDNITYQNPIQLDCAQKCGQQVRISFYSACRAAPDRVFPSRT